MITKKLKLSLSVIVAIVLLFLSVNPVIAESATGVIVARTSTVETIKKLLSAPSVYTYAGRQYICGNYMGHNVVLVRSPMGKVNNTITTQILMTKFDISLVISIAPAGAVNENVNIGNIVVANEVYQHDFGTEKPYGFIWGKTPDGTGWEEAGYSFHPNVPNTEKIIKQSNEKKLPKVFTGCVVSGDQLIASPAKRAWLKSKFNALAVDMSAAAIAQTCFANMVPCQIIRVITDHADASARSDFEASFLPVSLEPDYQLLFKALMATEA